MKTEQHNHHSSETILASVGGDGLIIDLPETLGDVHQEWVDVIPAGLPPSPVLLAAAPGSVAKGPEVQINRVENTFGGPDLRFPPLEYLLNEATGEKKRASKHLELFIE